MTIALQVGGREFDSIQAGFQQVATAIERGLDRSAQPVSRELRKTLGLIYKKMREKHGLPWRPGGSLPDRLYRRSGDGLEGMRRSIKVTGAGSLRRLQGSITAPFPIAVHEEGAVVRPRTAQYLTIPLEAALDARGVPRKRRARDWDDTFVQRSKRGNLLIFQRRGAGIVPLYLLKTEVRLRPRLGFIKTGREMVDNYFERRAIDAIEKSILRQLGG